MSREENYAKNNQNSRSLSKILVYNLWRHDRVPFNRSMANSSNSSKVMLSVGGILYICKLCVCVQAFCELSRGLIRLLLFFRLPVNCIFLAQCMWLCERFDRLFSRQMKRAGKLVHSPFAIFQLPANCIVVNLWIGGHFEVRCTKVVAAIFHSTVGVPYGEIYYTTRKTYSVYYELMENKVPP